MEQVRRKHLANQELGMVPDMVKHKSGNEKIAMVIAVLVAEGDAGGHGTKGKRKTKLL